MLAAEPREVIQRERGCEFLLGLQCDKIRKTNKVIIGCILDPIINTPDRPLATVRQGNMTELLSGLFTPANLR